MCALVGVLLMCGTASGQTSDEGALEGALRFESEVWDFGQIREVDGVVCHTFVATNRDVQPVVIERIYTSCGCTSTEYSKQPVLVGAQAQVKVCFDPSGRPGEFEKRVNVILNGGRRQTLTVRGVVEGRPRTVEDDYPYYMVRGLRVDNATFGMGTVQHGAAQSTVINYVNTSEQTLRPKVRYQLRSGALRVAMPEKMAPGERGQITLTYDLRAEQQRYGNLVDKFTIEVDGRESEHAVYVAAIAVDDFSLANYDTAPTAEVSERMHDFGVIAADCGELRYQLSIKNLGDEELIIRWVEPKDEGFYVTLRPGTRIKSGDKVIFEAVLNPDYYTTAEISDAVAVVTNDPMRAYRQFRVAARRAMNKK